MVKGATGGLTGRYKIELSLFTPPGDGPFPLVLYNHGDITADSVHVTEHLRYRDMCIANEFLAMGLAVAMPAHPGVGRSEDTYQRYMSNTDVSLARQPGFSRRVAISWMKAWLRSTS